MRTYTELEVIDLIKKAYIEGFSISAEGFNAEYPFDDEHERIDENPTINHHLNSYINNTLLKHNFI